jgi:hypothetical protein
MHEVINMEYRVVFALAALILAVSMAALAPRTASAEEITIHATATMTPAPAGGFITCVTPPGVDPIVMARVSHAEETFEGLGSAATVQTIESCALTATGLNLVGHAIRTFDNGDKWYVSWTTTVDPVTGAFVVHGHGLDRGTGQFAGATASLEATGTFDLTTGNGEYTITGSVTTATISPPSTGDGGLKDDTPGAGHGYLAGVVLLLMAGFASSLLLAGGHIRNRETD